MKLINYIHLVQRLIVGGAIHPLHLTFFMVYSLITHKENFSFTLLRSVRSDKLLLVEIAVEVP